MKSYIVSFTSLKSDAEFSIPRIAYGPYSTEGLAADAMQMAVENCRSKFGLPPAERIFFHSGYRIKGFGLWQVQPLVLPGSQVLNNIA